MYQFEEMDEYLAGFCPTQKIFDKFRVVDPNTNEIYRYVSGELNPTGRRCFEIWDRARPCRNCISRRAASEGGNVMKLEYLEGRVNLIWAIPIQMPSGDGYVLELAKDVTDSMMVSDILHKDNTDITALILEFNELAITDLFTGLYNKKYIENELPQSIRRAKEGTQSLAAAVADIDRFKLVNDRYGHEAGDRVIQTLAGYIREAVGQEGCWAARMGGDEFLLVFEGLEPCAVERRCAQLADSFAGHPFSREGQRFFASVSVGLKEFDPANDEECNFLQQVDQRMYRMKKRGAGARAQTKK